MDTTYQKILEMRKKQLDTEQHEVDHLKEKKTPSPLVRKRSKDKDSPVKTRRVTSKISKSSPKILKLSAESEITDVGAALNSSPKLANEVNGQVSSENDEIQSKPTKKQPARKAPARSKKATPAAKSKTLAKNTKQQEKTKEISPNKQKTSIINEKLDTNTNGNLDEASESNVESDESDSDLSHSVLEGKNLFAWLINPVKTDLFFEKTWEKKPLHIKRTLPKYYENVLSTKELDHILRNQRVEFTKNLDITSYSEGQRETHNLVGRAYPPVVWDFYSNGCSVRLINPQSFCRKVHLLCTTLQEFFGCMVGANSYLTPPGSQGFAPHYDDIEAFVIQIEGKKHWKLYAPRVPSEVLPRTSSKNFSRDEIGEPILDVVLSSGDILYFPRGTIHEACTLPDEHSLHITISMYQKHSWADLLEKLVPSMISRAISENLTFREGLPLDISNHMGLVHSDSKSSRRQYIITMLKGLLSKTFECAAFDTAVDEIYKEFQHSALPPVLTPHEISCTIFGDGERIKSVAEVANRVELTPDTKVRLLRANIIRMVMEDEMIKLYFYVENTTEYHAVDSQFLEVAESQAPAIEYLILKYPKYIPISALPLKLDSDKIALVDSLWEKGILVSSKPLDVFE